MHRKLEINPGTHSAKIAVYDDTELFKGSFEHIEAGSAHSIWVKEQFDHKKSCLLPALASCGAAGFVRFEEEIKQITARITSFEIMPCGHEMETLDAGALHAMRGDESTHELTCKC